MKRGRGIVCSNCARKFWGGGTSRVCFSVLFQFCGPCWRQRRQDCHTFMSKASARREVGHA